VWFLLHQWGRWAMLRHSTLDVFSLLWVQMYYYTIRSRRSGLLVANISLDTDKKYSAGFL
jgi:hypothetical protein